MEEKRQRKPHRLFKYDYSDPGAYFVTCVTQNRTLLFGRIEDKAMRLNDAGKAIDSIIREPPHHIVDIEMDEYVVMPNHIHMIVNICHGSLYTSRERQPDIRLTAKKSSISLNAIVQRFKSYSTMIYCSGVRNLGWKRFAKRLWQRDYYDHIVRDENDLNAIREYIICNPSNWPDDPETNV